MASETHTMPPRTPPTPPRTKLGPLTQGWPLSGTFD